MRRSRSERPVDLELIRSALYGDNLKKLLLQRGVKKYRIMKDCHVSYSTLCEWQAGRRRPSGELALRVGRYLGLIKGNDLDILELRLQLSDIRGRLKRLGVR